MLSLLNVEDLTRAKMQLRIKKLQKCSPSQPLTFILNDLALELKHLQTQRNVNCMHMCHAYGTHQNKEYINIKLPIDG